MATISTVSSSPGNWSVSARRYEGALKHFTAASSEGLRNPMIPANLARRYHRLARKGDSQREMDHAKALASDEAGHSDFMVKPNRVVTSGA